MLNIELKQRFEVAANRFLCASELLSCYEQCAASRELLKRAVSVLENAVESDAQNIARDIMNKMFLIMQYNSKINSFTSEQIMKLQYHSTDLQTRYLIKTLTILKVAVYDKVSKTLTFNVESEVFQTLEENARYMMQDDTLFIHRERKELVKEAKALNLIEANTHRTV